MPWKKGQSGNPKGAQPGLNRSKYEQRREHISKIIEAVITDENSIDELMNLEDKSKKWDIIAKLLPYYVPRLETQAPGDDVPVVQSHQQMILERLKEKKVA